MLRAFGTWRIPNPGDPEAAAMNPTIKKKDLNYEYSSIANLQSDSCQGLDLSLVARISSSLFGWPSL